MTARSAEFRILVADDEPPILEAYQRTLAEDRRADVLEAELFGGEANQPMLPALSVDYAQQGEEAVAAVRQACAEGSPFSVAFLDVRMPPGIDGVEAAKQIRALDPEINIVVVTGFSDVYPPAIAQLVPPVEKLFYIAKPFQAVEIQQAAMALAHRWLSDRTRAAAHERLASRCQELEQAFERMTSQKDPG